MIFFLAIAGAFVIQGSGPFSFLFFHHPHFVLMICQSFYQLNGIISSKR